MKILHINSYMLAGKFYRHLHREQERHGHDLTVFVPAPTSTAPATADVGYTADIVPCFTKPQRLVFPWKQRRILSAARERYNPAEYDIIHAHSLFANGNVALELSKLSGIPYIVAVRATDIDLFFQRMPHMRSLGVQILATASRIVFISEPARKRVLDRFIPQGLRHIIGSKSTVIPNGIAPEWLANQPPAQPSPAPGEPLRLIQVGDIRARKDPISSARAVRVLAERDIPATLTFAGPVHASSLERKLKRAPGVQLKGKLNLDALRDEYRAHQIMVLPSLNETFGLVYAEAMSQGLPVIFTRGQGFDGQFPDGQIGYSVPPKSPSAIADAVEKIARELSPMSHRALRAATRFDWNRITTRYDELYIAAMREATDTGLTDC